MFYKMQFYKNNTDLVNESVFVALFCVKKSS